MAASPARPSGPARPQGATPVKPDDVTRPLWMSLKAWKRRQDLERKARETAKAQAQQIALLDQQMRDQAAMLAELQSQSSIGGSAPVTTSTAVAPVTPPSTPATPPSTPATPVAPSGVPPVDELSDDQLAKFRPVVDSAYDVDVKTWYDKADKAARDKGLAKDMSSSDLERTLRSLIVSGYIAHSSHMFDKLSQDEAFKQGAGLGTSALAAMGEPDALGSSDPDNPDPAFKQAVNGGVSSKQQKWHERLTSTISQGPRASRQRLLWPVIMVGLSALCVYYAFAAFWPVGSIWPWVYAIALVVLLFLVVRRWRKSRPATGLIAGIVALWLLLFVIALTAGSPRLSAARNQVNLQQLQTEKASCASNGNCDAALVERQQALLGVVQEFMGACSQTPGNADCAKYVPPLNADNTYPTTGKAYATVCEGDADLVRIGHKPNPQCALFAK